MTPATKAALEILEVIAHLNLHGRVADSQKMCIETIRQALARQDAPTVTADEAVDVGALKVSQSRADFELNGPLSPYDNGKCDGWNDCIDHLVSTGRLK